MTMQLRDYQIAAGRLTDFVDAWRAGVLPLRRRYGFHVAAWTVEGEDRFVWLLSLEGSDEEFRRRDSAYYASPERAALQVDPAQWIVDARHVFLRPVAEGSI
ncbi:MAG TPA: hypothetical protein VML96_00530 [Egibacteraceae bacterium]|nr:hypothetical protein [Egibacteraceae bacterium]